MEGDKTGTALDIEQCNNSIVFDIFELNRES